LDSFGHGFHVGGKDDFEGRGREDGRGEWSDKGKSKDTRPFSESFIYPTYDPKYTPPIVLPTLFDGDRQVFPQFQVPPKPIDNSVFRPTVADDTNYKPTVVPVPVKPTITGGNSVIVVVPLKSEK